MDVVIPIFEKKNLFLFLKKNCENCYLITGKPLIFLVCLFPFCAFCLLQSPRGKSITSKYYVLLPKK